MRHLLFFIKKERIPKETPLCTHETVALNPPIVSNRIKHLPLTHTGQHSVVYDPPQPTVSASTVGSRAIASARPSASSVEGKFHGHAIPRKTSIYDGFNHDSGSEERVARRPEVVTTRLGGVCVFRILPILPRPCASPYLRILFYQNCCTLSSPKRIPSKDSTKNTNHNACVSVCVSVYLCVLWIVNSFFGFLGFSTVSGSTTTTTMPTSPLKMKKAISDEYNLDRTNSFLDSAKPQNQLLLRCAMMPCDVDDDESKTSVGEGSLEYAYDHWEIIPVLHTFYNKALRENDDGSVNLVGTMWTTVMFDQRGLEESKRRNAANAVNRSTFPAGTGAQSSAQTKHRDKFAEAWGFHGEFPIRINDRLARSPHQSHGSSGLNTHAITLDQWDPNYLSQDGQMFTYHCNIPMKKSYVYDMPPYQIVRFTVGVELGTITFQDTHPNGEKGNYTCRPDLMVNEKLNNFVFTKSQPSSKSNGKGEDMNAMNDMDSYFLVTPVPHVQLKYNKYRGCTQSYEIEYYCTGSFRHKFVATLFPLIYVATLTTISVFNPDDEWGGPNLENSIGLALTVVFILPELRPAGGDHDFSANDVSIMLLFLGHIMAGIAHPNLDDPANPGFIASGFNSTFAPETYGWIGMAGIVCVWIATLIIPLYNGLRYFWILHKIKAVKLPKDVKEAAKVANKEWVGPHRDTPKAHTGSVQEPSVHPDRPFSQSSLASGQQGGQFSSSVQSHMHANAYLKMCIHVSKLPARIIAPWYTLCAATKSSARP